MNVLPLSDRPSAVRAALLSHGWEGELAQLAAGGLEQSAFHVTNVDASTIEAMVPVAARLGLELVTGDDWLIVTGGRARFGAFARPWVQPEAVRDLATAIGMAMPGEPATTWRHARGDLALDRFVIVGVINVTPDSFSDAGSVASIADALLHTEQLLAGGAAVIDVGGESTRPGADPLPPTLEQQRVVPVIEAITRRFPSLVISVDTVHAETATAAIGAGAAIVNDVTAGRHDPALLGVAARLGAGLVLSHSRGALPQIASYDAADYGGDVTGGVIQELRDAMLTATVAGVADAQIVIDPGFGFGKTTEQSLALLHHLGAVCAIGRPVLVGVSRKRFLGQATGRAIADRDRATAAACALAYAQGARLFRVHDAAAVCDALAVAEAVAGASA